MLNVLRRVLGYRISIEQLIEIGLWLAVPFLFIGVVWAFLHPDQVAHFEAMLTRLPAGANLIAFGLTVALWPVLVIAPLLCPS